MSKLYYTIYFFDGKSVAITGDEMEKITNDISRGVEMIKVSGNLINVKNIARVGQHENTAQMKNWDRKSVERILLEKGKGHLIKEKKEKEKLRAMNVILKDREQDELAYTKDIKELDEPDYYLDENGEKMYS